MIDQVITSYADGLGFIPAVLQATKRGATTMLKAGTFSKARNRYYEPAADMTSVTHKHPGPNSSYWPPTRVDHHSHALKSDISYL